MATIVHFDIPVDNPERAKEFYSKLFNWKFQQLAPPMDYSLITTLDADGKEGIGGGMAKRLNPEQRITNFIGVKSIDETLLKIKKLGGKILESKHPVKGWGSLAICSDTENNTFGIWESDIKNTD